MGTENLVGGTRLDRDDSPLHHAVFLDALALLYGALDGERLDHTLANLQTLAFLCEHGAIGFLVGLRYMATAVQKCALRFSADATGILSVFCLGKDAQGVCLEQLKYPLDNGTLTGGFPLGVSNHFIGEAATVSVRSGILTVLYDVGNGFPEVLPC